MRKDVVSFYLFFRKLLGQKQKTRAHWDQGGNRSEQRCLENVTSSTLLTHTTLLAYVSFFHFSLKQ